ncbi:MAG: KH domain-containing protein [Anaerolineaceae bacterium]|nr:KH domain-containing protein [Anaerolineaceae bacterium]
MKSLIEYIVLSLVDNPTEVKVTQSVGGGRVHLALNVAPEDMGRVIGKGGRVANAMRILSRVTAAHDGKQVTLDVVEPHEN